MFLKVAAIFAVCMGIIYAAHFFIDKREKGNEALRKLLHVLHGTAIASLAFVVPLEIIVGFELLFFIAMFGSRYASTHFNKIPVVKIISRMYRVGRVSYGEFFFPLSVLLIAYIAQTKWEFAAAVLILGLADASAALIGRAYGAGNTYTVLGQNKSLAGSFAFLLVSMAILAVFSLFSSSPFYETGILAIFTASLAITLAENLGVYGSDNLLIPVVAVFFLNRF